MITRGSLKFDPRVSLPAMIMMAMMAMKNPWRRASLAHGRTVIKCLLESSPDPLT